eukprot:scaffold24601_cov22-Tisochrysis_lutea.AAC.1
MVGVLERMQWHVTDSKSYAYLFAKRSFVCVHARTRAHTLHTHTQQAQFMVVEGDPTQVAEGNAVATDDEDSCAHPPGALSIMA